MHCHSAVVIGCMLMLTVYFFCVFLDSVDPGRTDPRGAVCSGSTLFIFLYAGGCSCLLFSLINLSVFIGQC